MRLFAKVEEVDLGPEYRSVESIKTEHVGGSRCLMLTFATRSKEEKGKVVSLICAGLHALAPCYYYYYYYHYYYYYYYYYYHYYPYYSRSTDREIPVSFLTRGHSRLV